MVRKEREIKTIYALVLAVFAVFLAVPIIRLLMESFVGEAGTGVGNYVEVLTERGFMTALGNSVTVSVCSALLATVLAFFLAYSIQYTNLNKNFKSLIRTLAVLPMLLPTITYGFAIIYSFGKQGLLTKLFGRQLFDIYAQFGYRLVDGGRRIGYIRRGQPLLQSLLNFIFECFGVFGGFFARPFACKYYPCRR